LVDVWVKKKRRVILLSKRKLMPCIRVVYAMVFYNKTVAGLIQKAMSSPYFRTIFLALASMDRGNTMIRYGVDGVTGGPDMIISKLVCGTLAACATDLWSGK
jgi:uncharacterized protein (DUF1810 family)